MLADRAEELCRTYLPGGKRNGRHWRVGSVAGEAGQSLWVDLRGNDRGRWRDEAVPDHKGDMLDLIAAAKGIDLPAAMDEAARFLGLPPPEPAANADAAEGSFAAMLRDSLPVAPDDPAGRYLASRGLAAGDAEGCRFHPTLWVRVDGKVREEPALIVPLTDADGRMRAVHRIFVSEDGGPAAFKGRKRTRGTGKGLAARFGAADAERVVLCEGVEDALAVVRALDPEERRGVMVAASAGVGRIAGVELHAGVRRILLMQDRDRAGGTAWTALRARWDEEDPDVFLVRAVPRAKDANDELLEHGREALRALLEPLFAADPPTEPDADGPAAEGTEAGGNTDGTTVPTEIDTEAGRPEGAPADGADAAGGVRAHVEWEWMVFLEEWKAFREKADGAGVHPYVAQGYGDMHAHMRVLSSRPGLNPEARAWLKRQLAMHNEIAGRWERAEEHVLALRIVQDRRAAIEAGGGDILRADRYDAWREDEARLAAAGTAMLNDPAYQLPLNGIKHAIAWFEWAGTAIPSWHAGEAQRLEAGRSVGGRW